MSELPVGWEITTLGSLGIWSSGGTPSRKYPEYYGGSIPWVKTGDLQDGYIESTEEFLTDIGLRSSSAKIFPAGTLLLAMYGATIGRTGLLKIDATTNQACAALIADGSTKKLISFLWWFLIHKADEFKAIGQGGAQPNISLTLIKQFPLPLPPLPEQHRIVAKLDSLFTRSRRAREELERVPGLCDRYKQAVLAAAFRGDLTADWREENNPEPLLENKLFINSQQSELSDLPDEWVWTNVGQIAKVTGGLTKNQNRMKLERKVSYLRVANVYANELRLNEVLEIGITDAEWERVQLKTGDLLIVEGNGSIDQVGRVALWNGEIEQCAHQNHLIKVRVGNFISQKFLLHWLLSPNGRRTIELIASSSAGLHTLSISKVMTLPTPLCSIKEMEIIIRRVEKLFKAIDSIAQDYQKARQLLDRLDQATLAKAFRGELVPQDPNDEPAAALLERIQAERQAEPKGKAVRSKKSQS
jgi:type I restriction enzyme, S subunit